MLNSKPSKTNPNSSSTRVTIQWRPSRSSSNEPTLQKETSKKTFAVWPPSSSDMGPSWPKSWIKVPKMLLSSSKSSSTSTESLTKCLNAPLTWLQPECWVYVLITLPDPCPVLICPKIASLLTLCQESCELSAFQELPPSFPKPATTSYTHIGQTGMSTE